MKRFAALTLCLLLLLTALPALAGDVAIMDMRVPDELATDRSFLCLTCLGVEGDIRVTITDERGAMIYQKDYGARSGVFRSDDIYLGANSTSRCLVSLRAGDEVYERTLVRRIPRMNGVTACTAGCPLSLVTGRDSWKSVTILDLDAMDVPVVMPLQAAGAYALGQATFSLTDGNLMVHAELDDRADAVIDSARVYVASNVLDARRLDTRQFTGRTAALDQAMDVRGDRFVIVYVQLNVSFDPADAAPAPETEQPGQRELLEIMNRYTVNEEVG